MLIGTSSIIKLGKRSFFVKPCIILRLYGGIGNQLFSYAAAFRLAQNNDVTLYLDTISGFYRDHSYKRKYRLYACKLTTQRSFFWELIGLILSFLHPIINKWNRNNVFDKRLIIVQESPKFDERLLYLKINSPKFFEGFWQSEKYFFDILTKIRSEFEFKASLVTAVQTNFPLPDVSNAVAIHVRNFSDTLHSNMGNIQDVYYSKAIELYKKKIDKPHFYIFSDSPDLAIQRCSLKYENFTIVSNWRLPEGELGELYYMTLFRYFIIANSTFSWWGAWLSTQNDKIVVAPGEVVDSGEGCWGFEGLIPANWITIS